MKRGGPGGWESVPERGNSTRQDLGLAECSHEEAGMAEKKGMYRASRGRGQKLGRALLSIRPC